MRMVGLGLACLVLVSGCAPAYHRYAEGCVECRYCPPSPLPYSHYHVCDCRVHLASTSSNLSAKPEGNTSVTSPAVASAD